MKVGSISVPIYRHANIVYQRDTSGNILYRPTDAAGKQRALVKDQSDIFALDCYEGSKRVRLKFSDFKKTKREAGLAAMEIASGETGALKLKGHDRSDYVRALQKLRAWRPDADLNLVVTDYVANVSRLAYVGATTAPSAAWRFAIAALMPGTAGDAGNLPASFFVMFVPSLFLILVIR